MFELSSQFQLSLTGRTCLVTGASRGIGREVARMLAAEGARVAVCSRDDAALREVTRELRQSASDVLAIPADITAPGESSRVVEVAIDHFQSLEVLVTCAAGDAVVSVNENTSRLFDRITGKAIPAIESAQAAARVMVDQGYGRIVFLGGLAARTPFNHLGPEMGLERGQTTVAQGLGNATLSAFTKYLSDELAPHGVTVNIVHPGLVATSRTESRLQKAAENRGETFSDLLARIVEDIPLRRIVEPRDVANLVAFLASPLAGAITGQSVAVDGGQGRTILY